MRKPSLLFWISIFVIAFAFIESAVVIYLRGLYYPDGFIFPLKLITAQHISIEIAREFSTLIVLVALSIIAGKSRWERFAYFCYAFGMWDIFYYIWLKVAVNWPGSIFDWDVLFLIPVPWIGPVIAPVIVSILLITSGLMILSKEKRGEVVKPGVAAWSMAILGVVCILYTFMSNLDAALRFRMPAEYRWDFFVVGTIFLIIAMLATFLPRKKKGEG